MTMFAKTGVAVSVAVVLGAACSALASERDSSGGYQARQGIQEPRHASFMTDVGRAYALDESSKPKKKKVSKQQGNPTNLEQGKSSKAQAPSNPQTDEQAKQRRYEQNR
jgi:hypothetical protein